MTHSELKSRARIEEKAALSSRQLSALLLVSRWATK